MQKTLLCLGFGYTARALARRLLPRDWRVIGTSRDSLTPYDGVEMQSWPGTPLPLQEVSHVLLSISPNAEGDPVLARHQAEFLAAASNLEWVWGTQ